MRKKTLTAAIAVAAGSTVALGQIQVFTSQSAWETAVMNAGFTPVEEDFSGITINDMQPSNSPHVVNDDFSITVEGMDDDPDTAEIAGGSFAGEIFPDSGHSAYRHDFNTDVVAFGQFYEGAASGLGIQISTTSPDFDNIDIFDDGGYSGFDDGFLGFLATDGGSFSGIRVVGSDADGGTAVGEIYDATNATYAFVPAPGSAALLGLGGIAAARRRRR